MLRSGIYVSFLAMAATLALSSTPGANALASERTSTGPMEFGGVIRLTMDVDQTELQRLEFIDAHLSLQTCGGVGIPDLPTGGPGLNLTFYLDPPLGVSDGSFTFSSGNLHTPNNPESYFVEGTVDEDGSIQGTANRGATLVCGTPRIDHWTASGQFSGPPGPSDPVYADSAGSVVLTTDREGSLMTSLTLNDAELECEGVVNIRAFFDPAAPFVGPNDRFGASFWVIRPKTHAFVIQTTSRVRDDNTIAVQLRAGNVGGFCDAGSFVLARVVDERPTPTSQPRSLPSTGRGQPSGRNSVLVTLGIAGLFGGACLAGGGLLRRRTR